MPYVPHLAALLSAAIAASAAAQPLSADLLGTFPLPTAAVDQHGQVFAVTGVSGIWWTGTDPSGFERCWLVLDNSNKVIEAAITLDGNGLITAASILRALALPISRDYEDLVILTGDTPLALISEENTPAVRAFRLDTGAELTPLNTPAVLLTRRNNLGFEALTRDPTTGQLWTCTEEAVTADGPISTAAAGSVVRLLRFNPDLSSPSGFVPSTQLAYINSPLHGAATNGSRSGVVALIALPDSRLLVLERSYARVLIIPTFQLRLIEADLTAATDVTALPSLISQSYTPAGKRSLWTGNINNLEGLCLGPPLSTGDHVLLGIVDDGDPLSLNNLASFILRGPISPPPPCRADWNHADGVDSQDYFEFLEDFFADPPAADFNGVDGTDSQDLFEFLEAFFTGC